MIKVEDNEKEYDTLGKEVLADFWGVEYKILNNVKFLTELLKVAAEKSGANVIKGQNHKFTPQGVTVSILLSESHINIHTYPEKGFAMISMGTCGKDVDPSLSIEYLYDVLKPTHETSIMIKRGQGAGMEFKIDYGSE